MSSPSASGPLAPRAALPQLRPVATAGTAALIVLALALFGPSARAIGAAFVLCVVAIAAVVDLEERRIPNRVVLPAIALALGAQIASDPSRTLELVGFALGAGLFFYLPMLVSRGGMGMGDVKLAVFLGAALAELVLLAIAVAVFAAFFAAVAILLRDGAGARKSAIPFGPFLAVGAAVAILVS